MTLVLPREVLATCRDVLSRCDQFSSDINLRSVFILNTLKPFRKGLPSAISIQERVDLCLQYLIDRVSLDGTPALLLLLAALRDAYEGDELQQELQELCTQVEILAQKSKPVINTSPVNVDLPPPEKVDKTKLRDWITQHTNTADLEALCFDITQALGRNNIEIKLDLETVGGSTKMTKTINLIEWLNRRGWLSYLVVAIRQKSEFSAYPI